MAHARKLCNDIMKSMVIIPLAFAAAVMGVAGALFYSGMHIKPADALAAAIIGASAAALGLVPLWRGRHKDPVGMVQAALIGTVVHLLTALTLTLLAISTHLVDPRGAFMFWLLATYWLSMIIVIFQSRRMIAASTHLKVQS
jgi:hypothetical protein